MPVNDVSNRETWCEVLKGMSVLSWLMNIECVENKKNILTLKGRHTILFAIPCINISLALVSYKYTYI